jgi:hypothetical protein
MYNAPTQRRVDAFRRLCRESYPNLVRCSSMTADRGKKRRAPITTIASGQQCDRRRGHVDAQRTVAWSYKQTGRGIVIPEQHTSRRSTTTTETNARSVIPSIFIFVQGASNARLWATESSRQAMKSVRRSVRSNTVSSLAECCGTIFARQRSSHPSGINFGTLSASAGLRTKSKRGTLAPPRRAQTLRTAPESHDPRRPAVLRSNDRHSTTQVGLPAFRT